MQMAVFAFSILVLVAVAVFQSAFVLVYLVRTASQKAAENTRINLRVAVILCLRGADPGLRECLSNLYRQDYPEYEIHVVLDSVRDPANRILAGFCESLETDNNKLIVHVLDKVERQGSLKCQSLVYAVLQLAPKIDVVAFIDADAMCDPTWLTRLVAPLANHSIGATTGNRWFSPSDDKLGSWVRHVWNAAAIVQMQLYRIAWGGSLAIRKNIIHELGLLDRWKTSFCEDTMLTRFLEQQGLRVHRVPNLVVNNRESTSLASCRSWIVRQLLTARLYHRSWTFVFFHAICVGLAFAIPPVASVGFVLAGQLNSAMSVLVAWTLFQMWNFLLVRVITVANQRKLESAQADNVQMTKPNPIKYGLALIMAQLIQPYAALRAFFAKNVSWRGIRYRIDGQSVEIENYTVYHREGEDTTQSIQ